MNLLNRHKQQPPRLHKQNTLKFRVESFLADNTMWLLALVISIGSVSMAVLILIFFYSLAPATIGGIL